MFDSASGEGTLLSLAPRALREWCFFYPATSYCYVAPRALNLQLNWAFSEVAPHN